MHQCFLCDSLMRQGPFSLTHLSKLIFAKIFICQVAPDIMAAIPHMFNQKYIFD